MWFRIIKRIENGPGFKKFKILIFFIKNFNTFKIANKRFLGSEKLKKHVKYAMLD